MDLELKGVVMGESEKLGKKNIMLAILSLILVGIVVLIVLNIIRNPNQTINPFFKVTYKVTAVDAKVEASYQEEGSLTQKYFKNLEDNKDYIEFDHTDENPVTKALSMTQELQLQEYTSHYVLFIYTFTNRNASRKLRVTMTDTSLKENVAMYYATSDEITSTNSFVDLVEQIQLLNYSSNSKTALCDKATTDHDTQVTIYALFTIYNEKLDATYQTAGENTLLFELTSVS